MNKLWLARKPYHSWKTSASGRVPDGFVEELRKSVRVAAEPLEISVTHDVDAAAIPPERRKSLIEYPRNGSKPVQARPDDCENGAHEDRNECVLVREAGLRDADATIPLHRVSLRYTGRISRRGFAVPRIETDLRPSSEFTDGSMGFIDGLVKIGLAGCVGVRDGDATQRLAAEHMRLLAFFELRIE